MKGAVPRDGKEFRVPMAEAGKPLENCRRDLGRVSQGAPIGGSAACRKRARKAREGSECIGCLYN